MTTGYRNLDDNRAYVDVSGRGRILVTGEDRARLIHALTTNHVQQMKPEDRLYAFFLTAQGRIVSDCHIMCTENHLLLDVEPGVREALIQHIDHYIIADDVALEDVTDTTFSLFAAGKRLYGSLPEKEQLLAGLNMVPATADDFETYRVEHFHPLFGKDFTTANLPQETGLTNALHFNKGCYIGQEIVERIRSRGHVNKMLVGLKVQGEGSISSEAKVHLNGEDIGQVTSTSGASAIAMVRIIGAKPGTLLQINGFSAEVHAVS